MIDVHCHMLPAIDDGARDLSMALQMAEMAVADGISRTVCTPHIYPGLFENTHESIRQATADFQQELKTAGIALQVSYGADVQVVPSLVQGLQSKALPTINGSRYFLFEPPHHVSMPRLADLIHAALLAGYVPVITHPERLSYIEDDYDLFIKAARQGAWLQLTGGSLLGVFGSRVQRVAERFMEDGVIHLLASDGHNLKNRSPVLTEARKAAAQIVGDEEANLLVQARPLAIINNEDAATTALPPGLNSKVPYKRPSRRRWWSRLMS